MALSRKSPTLDNEDILKRTCLNMLRSEITSLLSGTKDSRTHVIKIITFRDNVIPHVHRHSTHNDATQFLDEGVKVIAESWGKGDTNKHFADRKP